MKISPTPKKASPTSSDTPKGYTGKGNIDLSPVERKKINTNDLNKDFAGVHTNQPSIEKSSSNGIKQGIQ
ncbi:MAG: hypothetical protein IPL22_04870 [Bacteroidetes bacterium]|nr:hypothetical protein [Bacteroidota bacterium]